MTTPIILAAWRGDEGYASELISASSDEASRRGWTSHNYARAVLYNGLGRHDAARDAALEAWQRDPIGKGTMLVPELAEAAFRTGDRALLQGTLDWLSERTGAISSRWASGIEARVRALLSEGEIADALYRQSIEHLSGTRLRPQLAGLICSTAIGSGVSGDERTLASNCGPPTNSSRASVQRRSPSVQGWS